MKLFAVLLVGGILVAGTWTLLDHHFDGVKEQVSEQEKCWLLNGDHVRGGICYIDKDGVRSVVNLREGK